MLAKDLQVALDEEASRALIEGGETTRSQSRKSTHDVKESWRFIWCDDFA